MNLGGGIHPRKIRVGKIFKRVIEVLEQHMRNVDTNSKSLQVKSGTIGGESRNFILPRRVAMDQEMVEEMNKNGKFSLGQ